MDRYLLICLIIVKFSSNALAEDGAYAFELKTRGRLGRNAPVTIPLPSELESAGSLLLTTSSHNGAIPIQKSADGKHAIFLLPDAIDGEQARVFDLRAAEQAGQNIVRVIEQPDQLSFQIDDSIVLTYHTSIVEPPSGFSKLYRRSGHVHPFRTPEGRVVTDGFPVDHMHQHGIFAAWTKTFFEGERVDFWNQKAGTGTVVHAEVLKLSSGPVCASAKVRLVHNVLRETTRPVLEEIWTLRLYNNRDVSIFDIESIQTCVADSPLTIAEYHYGGFAFRGSSEWEGKESHEIITNETTDRIAGNHTRPDWVSISGEVKGETCGAAMFSHPQNFRSPQPVRLHPSMPYFVYAPSVLGEFKLMPDKSYVTKHRYIAFDGDPDQDEINQLWTDYSQSPEIVWKEVE